MVLLPMLGGDRLMRLSPGSAALRGPLVVVGQAGGSLAVTCEYDARYERDRKWWCREEDLGGCRNPVETAGTEEVVRKDRVTIRDDQSQHKFTVTVEGFRDNDTGPYWCGIQGKRHDLKFLIRVTISSANTGPTTMATFSSNASTVPDALEENTGSPNKTHHPSKAGSLLSSVHFLLLVFLKVPLLLVMMGTVIWASWPQRGPRKQTETLQSQSVEGPQKLGCQAKPGSPPCRALSPTTETLPANS
ncbi:CMRF35-like molecule 5 [Sorex fumeus]|uniref:CMRF35-like molecule 5 n=1 Tax=Sorex fumeus TaxID=62283 RepID=UPI0024ADA18C|nr:CMRF35-like molecule 5 [Sorex fumeus]